MAITLALHSLTRVTQTQAIVHDRKGYEASSIVILGERARMTVMVSARTSDLVDWGARSSAFFT